MGTSSKSTTGKIATHTRHTRKIASAHKSNVHHVSTKKHTTTGTTQKSTGGSSKGVGSTGTGTGIGGTQQQQ